MRWVGTLADVSGSSAAALAAIRWISSPRCRRGCCAPYHQRNLGCAAVTASRADFKSPRPDADRIRPRLLCAAPSTGWASYPSRSAAVLCSATSCLFIASAASPGNWLPDTMAQSRLHPSCSPSSAIMRCTLTGWRPTVARVLERGDLRPLVRRPPHSWPRAPSPPCAPACYFLLLVRPAAWPRRPRRSPVTSRSGRSRGCCCGERCRPDAEVPDWRARFAPRRMSVTSSI